MNDFTKHIEHLYQTLEESINISKKVFDLGHSGMNSFQYNDFIKAIENAEHVLKLIKEGVEIVDSSRRDHQGILQANYKLKTNLKQYE